MTMITITIPEKSAKVNREIRSFGAIIAKIIRHTVVHRISTIVTAMSKSHRCTAATRVHRIPRPRTYAAVMDRPYPVTIVRRHRTVRAANPVRQNDRLIIQLILNSNRLIIITMKCRRVGQMKGPCPISIVWKLPGRHFSFCM